MTPDPAFFEAAPGFVLGAALAFAAGLAAWPGVEYLIHYTLSHRYRTFVTPLHMGHHRDPRGVLTAPHAWIPTSLALWAGLGFAIGFVWATPAILGLLVGFARYERLHWRIHFDTPKTPREELLFAHHLAHHYRDPKHYHGVTTRLYDRVFGTLPADCEADYAAVRGRPPLTPVDTFAVYRPGGLRRMRERGRERPTG